MKRTQSIRTQSILVITGGFLSSVLAVSIVKYIGCKDVTDPNILNSLEQLLMFVTIAYVIVMIANLFYHDIQEARLIDYIEELSEEESIDSLYDRINVHSAAAKQAELELLDVLNQKGVYEKAKVLINVGKLDEAANYIESLEKAMINTPLVNKLINRYRYRTRTNA